MKTFTKKILSFSRKLSFISELSITRKLSFNKRFSTGKRTAINRKFACAVLLASSYFGASNVLAEQQKDFSLSISPDGQQILFYSYRGNDLPDLYIADVDGKNEFQLTNTQDTWEIVPSWSPDGKSVLYAAGPSMMDLEIYLIPAQGGKPKKVTDGKGKGHAPSWMPDGKSFYYTRMYKNDTSDIHRKWLDSGTDKNLTENYSGKNLVPVVSPSGKQIAFASDRGEGDDLDVFVADTNFNHVKQILEDEQRQDFITWTPDEDAVIFSGPNQETGKHNLYSISIESGDITRITNDPDNHHYFSSFSHDGKFLYLDVGDWDRNFFFYRADWTGKLVEPTQVTGKDWVDSIAVMEQTFLAPMVGTWKGVSTHGNGKGRFEEHVTYQWGPNKKSLVVNMELFWDGQSYGKASGLLGLDRSQGKVFYNLTMEDGTIVMQEQQNAGEPAAWEMAVATFGNSRFYPESMFVKYSRNGNDNWKSEIFAVEDGEHTLIDVHEFSLIE